MVSTNELYGLEKQKGPKPQSAELFTSNIHTEAYELPKDSLIRKGDVAMAGFLNATHSADGYRIRPGDNTVVHDSTGRTWLDLSQSPYSDAGILSADQNALKKAWG